jgi:hypothetical protein
MLLAVAERYLPTSVVVFGVSVLIAMCDTGAYTTGGVSLVAMDLP